MSSRPGVLASRRMANGVTVEIRVFAPYGTHEYYITHELDKAIAEAELKIQEKLQGAPFQRGGDGYWKTWPDLP